MPPRCRRLSLAPVVAALVFVASLSACGGSPARTPSGPVHSRSAIEARLADLRGVPVVNQWASWCGPCRFEFPFFQHLAKRYEGRAALLGVDSQDNRGDADEFLKKLPVPYPHFYDENASIALVFRGGRAWPTR